MAGTDDFIDVGTGASDTIVSTDAPDGCVRNPRTLVEFELRLVKGGKVHFQSHGRSIDRKRRNVKTTNGLSVVSAVNGYALDMVRRATRTEISAPHDAIEIIQAALIEAIGDRPLKQVSDEYGIPYTTLRRIVVDGKTPNFNNLGKLSKVPGFDAALKRLRAAISPAVTTDTAAAMMRLQAILSPVDLEAVIYSIEDMHGLVGSSHIAPNLRQQVTILRDIAAQISGSKKKNH